MLKNELTMASSEALKKYPINPINLTHFLYMPHKYYGKTHCLYESVCQNVCFQWKDIKCQRNNRGNSDALNVKQIQGA